MSEKKEEKKEKKRKKEGKKKKEKDEGKRRKMLAPMLVPLVVKTLRVPRRAPCCTCDANKGAWPGCSSRAVISAERSCPRKKRRKKRFQWHSSLGKRTKGSNGKGSQIFQGKHAERLRVLQELQDHQRLLVLCHLFFPLVNSQPQVEGGKGQFPLSLPVSSSISSNIFDSSSKLNML